MTIGDSTTHRRVIRTDALTERIGEQNAIVILLLVIPVCFGATYTEYFLPVLPLNATLYLHLVPSSYTNVSLVLSEVRDSGFQNTSYVIMWNSSLQLPIDNQMTDIPELKGWYILLDQEAYIYLTYTNKIKLQLHPYSKTDVEYISLPLVSSTDTASLIVFATKDSTSINITGRSAGVDSISTINKQTFESVMLDNLNSSTVLYLTSNQPIGVFQMVFTSTTEVTALQMLLPSCQWGSTFIFIPTDSSNVTLSFSGLQNTNVNVYSSITQQCGVTRLDYCHVYVSSTEAVLITSDIPIQAIVSSLQGTFQLPSTQCSNDFHRLNVYASNIGVNSSILASTISDDVLVKDVCTDQAISGNLGSSVISRGTTNVTLINPKSSGEVAVAYMKTVTNKSLVLFLQQSNTGSILPIFNYLSGTASSAMCSETVTTTTTQQPAVQDDSGDAYERPNYGLVVGISLATSIFLVVVVIGGFLAVEVYHRRKTFSRTKVTPLVS